MIARIAQIQEKLIKEKIDYLLISSSYNIGYLTDFFGFSKTEREGYALLTHRNMYIFASGLNSEAVRNHLKSLCVNVKHTGCDIASHIGKNGRITLVEISLRSPLTKKALASIIKKERIKRLGFEKYNLLYSEYEKLKNDLAVALVPTEHLIEELRMVKTIDEIASIEKACKLGDKAFEYILSKIKEGITEKELAFQIELFIRNQGAELSFPSIVAFGANSSIPHHVTSDKRLAISDRLILLDFGVTVDNYCSDMTRTVFFGKPSSEQKRMYQTVLDAQKQAVGYIYRCHDGKKGINAKNVDRIARDHITSKGFPTIPHSLGHGIGLEVHEPPRLSMKSKDVLKPGMVFSIEPGIYIPGLGGIRIEDLVVLESSGPRFLTKAKRELFVL